MDRSTARPQSVPNFPEILRAAVFWNLDELLKTVTHIVNRAEKLRAEQPQNMKALADGYVAGHAFTLFTQMKNALSASPKLQITDLTDVPTMEARLTQAIAVARRELERLPSTYEAQAQMVTADLELRKAYVQQAANWDKLIQNFLNILDAVLHHWNPYEEVVGSSNNVNPKQRLTWAQTRLPKYHGFLIKLQEYDISIQKLMQGIGDQYVEHKRYQVKRSVRISEMEQVDDFVDRTELFERTLTTNGAKAYFANLHYTCIWSLLPAKGDVEFLLVRYEYFRDAESAFLNLLYPVPTQERQTDPTHVGKLTDTLFVRNVRLKSPSELAETLKKLKEQRALGAITSRKQGVSVEWQMQTANSVILLGKG